MKKLAALFLMISQLAFAVETGPANSVMRVPNAGGRPKFGSMDLSKSAAVGSSVLAHGNGGTDLSSAGSAGNQLISDGTNWTSAMVKNPYNLRNLGIVPSVSSNNLTVALKQADGSSNCSSTSPCIIGFRSTTAAAGDFNTASITGALSITAASGATFGLLGGSVNQYLYVYAQYNSGTPELCLSANAHIDEGTLQTTTTISNAATTFATLYCSTGRSSQPIRLLGRLQVAESSAGVYASNANEWSLIPFKRTVQDVYAYYYNDTHNYNSSATQVCSTKGTDTTNSYNNSNGIYTFPVTGTYMVTAGYHNGTFNPGTFAYIAINFVVNGVTICQSSMGYTTGTSVTQAGNGSCVVQATAGQQMIVVLATNQTLATASGGTLNYISVGLIRQ